MSANPPKFGPATDGRLHVMSLNLRNPSDPPPRSWPQRRPLIRELLTAERPTLLGTQEGYYHQLTDLRADLPGYDMIQLSRDGGSADESMAIFFDTARLEPIEYRHLWLSDTPRLIGSTSWGNEITRMLTWARFADRAAGREFVHLNTHFDHASAPARLRSAELVRDLVDGFDVPVIVGGDFNVGADSDPHRTLTSGNLTDTWDRAKQRHDAELATFNAWDPAPKPGDRIDWLLTTPQFDVDAVAVNAWTPGEQTPSDHWPVQAILRW